MGTDFVPKYPIALEIRTQVNKIQWIQITYTLQYTVKPRQDDPRLADNLT